MFHVEKSYTPYSEYNRVKYTLQTNCNKYCNITLWKTELSTEISDKVETSAQMLKVTLL